MDKAAENVGSVKNTDKVVLHFLRWHYPDQVGCVLSLTNFWSSTPCNSCEYKKKSGQTPALPVRLTKRLKSAFPSESPPEKLGGISFLRLLLSLVVKKIYKKLMLRMPVSIRILERRLSSAK